ncbi:MAG: protein-methionine-sulfoxide reductase catalytic subunit MsrP, partial [Alphaproteobacteria bacterium]|nr:protein-methionine-sulfoxide reductase catalytic subunit MsrP [Alphaproteobacteria bacterium]
MLIKRRRGWELPESAATPESVYLNRRALLGGLGMAAIGGSLPLTAAFGQDADPSAKLYPVTQNPKYTL